MRGINNRNKTAAVALVAVLLAIFASSMFVQGATIISGTTSGTWSPSGNPYIVSAYTEVISGSTLVIEPGVDVVIGPDVELRINGTITAVGTVDDPILFMGTSPSNSWERIFIYQASGSEFGYCEFSDAKTALYLHVYSGNRVMNTTINSCVFKNCVDQAIYGYAQGVATGPQSYYNATLNTVVKNCTFVDLNRGCQFLIRGGRYSWQFGTYTGYGYANPILSGNIFSNLTGKAIDLTAGSYAGGGVPIIANNIFSNCDGTSSVSPYDTDIINNIFVGCSNAVTRTGSSSLDVNYNCFYNNVADFVGYGPTYGQVIWSNDNGDPCDLFYNIFFDPQFELGSFTLSTSSPCIDAGDPSIVDLFAPIPGTSVSDMGAYGGANPGPTLPPEPPTITTQPQNQTVFLHQPVDFVVAAAGPGLFYQWNFNSAELTGETGSTLSIASAQYADAGNYSVVVSNLYGTVTSSSANLRVTEIGLDIAMHAGLHMTNLNVGTTYSIQYVNSLTDTNWTEITTFEAAADNDLWFDPEPANQQSKFYQVLSLP